MTLASFFRLLPQDLTLTLADIGSAGGLQPRWRPARRHVAAMLFEPREDGAVRQVGQDRIYPTALSSQPGRETLNITALANMSSTLVPNGDLLSTFRKKGPHVEIVDRIELQVDMLDQVCARDGRSVDAMKVDTQGSELAILKGCELALKNSVLLAEVEISFLERYKGQALAAEIIGHMAARGFDLIEIHRPKRYRAKNSSNVANPGLGLGQRAGRIAYADAIFFIQEQRLLDRLARLPSGDAETIALRAMVSLMVYGKADVAARLLDLTGDYLDAGRRTALARYFRSLGRRRLRSNLAHRAFDYLARHV